MKICKYCKGFMVNPKNAQKYHKECSKKIRRELRKRYNASVKGKEAHIKYQNSEKGKETRRKYYNSEGYKEAIKKYQQTDKFKRLQRAYAKKNYYKIKLIKLKKDLMWNSISKEEQLERMNKLAKELLN